MTEEIFLPKVRGSYKKDANIINWFGIKTKAEIMFKPEDTEDLELFLKNISHAAKLTIIGAASNVIIKDEGISGILIKLGKNFSSFKVFEDYVEIGGANICSNLSSQLLINSLGGLEFLTTIPGSIGGAIAMNAGCYGSDISQILISATAIDYKGNLVEIENSEFDFKYRSNKLADKYIFLSGKFRYEKKDKAKISDKIFEYSKKREESQPIRAKTGGSTFKNPENSKAWELIDKAGFRGAKIGDAQFSEKHCNFLINAGKATASDLITLAKNAQKKIKNDFGIELEMEIKILE